MAVSLQLDTVQARCLHALGRVRIVAGDTFHVPGLHLLGKGTVRSLTFMGRGYHRQPIGLGPAGAPPQVRELQHHRGAVFVAGVGQVLEPGNDLVAVGQDIVEHRWAVARDGGRAGRHGECNTGLGALHMVGPVTLLGHAVLRVRRLVRRGHDAVFQAQVLELVGLQQRIVLG